MKLPYQFELVDGTLEELNGILSQPNFKGVILNLSDELYHQCKGWSRSRIEPATKSISHFLENLAKKREVTDAMEFGTDTHCAILEPQKFKETYVRAPAKDEYENLLEKSDDIKAHIAKFINTAPLKEKLSQLEKFAADTNAELQENLKCLEDELAGLVQGPEELKKDFTVRQKAMKDKIKELNAGYKSLLDANKEDVKKTKAEIQALESKTSGNKTQLIKNLREFDKEIPVWDEIMSSFEEANVGKRVVTKENLYKLNKILKNAERRKILRYLLSSGFSEITFFWTDAETGLLLKIRIDFLSITEEFGFLPLDFKTCRDAEESAFVKDIANKNYHFQAAQYLEGLNNVLEEILKTRISNFLFIPVENEGACEINNVMCGPVSLEQGHKMFRNALRRVFDYYEAIRNEREHEFEIGYSQEIKTIELPIWKLA